MITKEYYQLDDFKHRFDLTESDIRYLIEEKKIPLVFKVKPQDFIIGHTRKHDFVGHCSVSYGGLVRIRDFHIQGILSGKEVRPARFILLQKGKVRYVNTKYNLEEKWPNEYLQGWKPKYLNDIESDTFEAKLFPHLQTNTEWQLQQITAYSLAFIDKSRKEEAHEEAKRVFGDLPEKVLRPNWLYFKFSDLCVQHETLEELGIVSSSMHKDVAKKVNSTEERRVSLQQISPAFKFKNQFEELLVRIISAHPVLSAKKICRILSHESQLEEDTRDFDTDNILLDEVESVICWRDKYRNNAQRSYTQDSIGNLISTLKKKIHEHTV